MIVEEPENREDQLTLAARLRAELAEIEQRKRDRAETKRRVKAEPGSSPLKVLKKVKKEVECIVIDDDSD